jgi:hypothetical protein
LDNPQLWLFAVVVGPVLLALAMGYALYQWRHRKTSLDPSREQATKTLYEKEERREKDSGVEPPA